MALVSRRARLPLSAGGRAVGEVGGRWGGRRTCLDGQERQQALGERRRRGSRVLALQACRHGAVIASPAGRGRCRGASWGGWRQGWRRNRAARRRGAGTRGYRALAGREDGALGVPEAMGTALRVEARRTRLRSRPGSVRLSAPFVTVRVEGNALKNHFCLVSSLSGALGDVSSRMAGFGSAAVWPCNSASAVPLRAQVST
jgi:hypothetical protein